MPISVYIQVFFSRDLIYSPYHDLIGWVFYYVNVSVECCIIWKIRGIISVLSCGVFSNHMVCLDLEVDRLSEMHIYSTSGFRPVSVISAEWSEMWASSCVD